MTDTTEATKPTDESRTDANVGVQAIVRPDSVIRYSTNRIEQ